MIINELINLGAIVASQMALSTGPASLVTAFIGTQPFFVLLFTLITSIWFAKIVHDFEKRKQVGYIQTGDTQEPDYLLDDTALVIRTHKGIVVITGCSHSGICNIISQAKKVFHTETITSVLGGFHLRSAKEDRIQNTTDFFEKNVTETVYAGHCTGFKAKYSLNTKVPVEEPFVGETIEIS